MFQCKKEEIEKTEGSENTKMEGNILLHVIFNTPSSTTLPPLQKDSKLTVISPPAEVCLNLYSEYIFLSGHFVFMLL